MRSTLLIVSLSALLLAPLTVPAAVQASVGGVTVQDDHPFETEAGQPDAQVIRSVDLVIADLGPDNQVKLIDPRTEREMVLKLTDAVPLRARSKKQFDGRKQLAFDDLAKGQKIRLSFRPNDGAIIRLTVLKIA